LFEIFDTNFVDHIVKMRKSNQPESLHWNGWTSDALPWQLPCRYQTAAKLNCSPAHLPQTTPKTMKPTTRFNILRLLFATVNIIQSLSKIIPWN
jgi:hypothetical protein